MRQMTCTQAATCGENLKVRVTPEQNEKMQVAWVAAGKMKSIILKTIDCKFLFLYSDNDILFERSSEGYFEKQNHEEIELIDDLPQTDFASQQEVWLWLGNDNKIIHSEAHEIVGFKNGVLWNFTDNIKSNHLISRCKEWQKHTPPRLIRANGVEVPAPLESLDGLDVVYIADVTDKNKFFKLDTDCEPNKGVINYWLKLGLLYAAKEDAIARAEAMLKFEVVE